MLGANQDLSTQITLLHDILKKSPVLYELISKTKELRLPHVYIGAGCVAQTVWNAQLGHDPLFGISDVDLVYYDPSDLSAQTEALHADQASALFQDCPLTIDVNNQARVHLWYREYFGYDIAPYPSAEIAINSWPTTATAVGVRLANRSLTVYAPFGLNDLFCQTVRANKVQITPEIYRNKCEKWLSKWPSLTVVPW